MKIVTNRNDESHFWTSWNNEPFWESLLDTERAHHVVIVDLKSVAGDSSYNWGQDTPAAQVLQVEFLDWCKENNIGPFLFDYMHADYLVEDVIKYLGFSSGKNVIGVFLFDRLEDAIQCKLRWS